MQRVCWLARWLEREDPANLEPALLSRLGPKALFSWNPLGRLPSDFSVPYFVRTVRISVSTGHLFRCLHFFLSPWCLLHLLDQNRSPPSVGTVSSNSSFLFSTILFLILRELKAFIKVYFDTQRVGHDWMTEQQQTGLFTEWLWGKVVVSWSFHFVETLARRWPFSVPHLINIKNKPQRSIFKRSVKINRYWVVIAQDSD